MTRCPSCGSGRLLQRNRLSGALFIREIYLAGPPAPFGPAYQCELRAAACTECGHVQLYATDVAALQAAYERMQQTTPHVVPASS